MKVLFGLSFLAAFAFQLAALPYYSVPLPSGGEAAPDFVLIVVAFAALHLRSGPGIIAALLAGAAIDVLSIDPPGTHAVSYVTAAFTAGWCRKRGLEDDALARLAFLAAASVAALGASAGWLWLVRADRLIPGLEAALGGLACNVLLGSVVFAILVPIRRGLERKEGTWFARA